MNGFTVSFVERRDPETSSIEKVFSVVGKMLSARGIQIRHDKLSYGNSMAGMVANLFSRRPLPADIFHVTGHIHYYALLLPVKKTVLTIHDLHILRSRKGIRRFFLKKLFFDLPARRIKFITVVSEQTKRELMDITQCPDEKIRVIENPITVKCSTHARPFNRSRPTFLQIGTTPNKNLSKLILALKGLECDLRIIGRLDENSLSLLRKHNIRFENLFEISDSEMLDEYQNADIVTFCSTSEGFGLPIIEAQAMMVPVITSNISPMSEVAGNSAVLADPYDAASIRSAIEIIIHDEKRRADAVKAGLENVKRFQPDRIAQQYEELYRAVLDQLN